MHDVPQQFQELYEEGHKLKSDALRLFDEWPTREDSRRLELEVVSDEFVEQVNSLVRAIRRWFTTLHSQVLPHIVYEKKDLTYHLGRIEEHLRHPNYQAELQAQKDVVRSAIESALALIESLPASLRASPPNAKELSELDSNIPPPTRNTHDFFDGLFATPAKHGVDVAAKYVFLDIVGFTRNRTVEAQADIVKQLNAIVIEAVKESGSPRDKFIFIPTGDGICIGLLNVEAPVDVHMQIALSILERISKYNASAQNKARQFQVRIGINANTDTLVVDINNRQNIAGAGISMASRIMGLADGDQIIVGQSVYDTLRYREKYDSAFRSYRATVKHGAMLDVYQFVAGRHNGLNTEEPKSLKSAEAESSFLLPSFLENVGGYAIDSFTDEKQLYEYLGSRIQTVTDNIKDVSLGPGSERTPDYRQQYYNLRSQVIKQKDIYYRYLCMLATSSRVERVRNELNEFSQNRFFVGLFESHPDPIPMISFIVIDDKEVIVGAHRRLHSPSQRNSDVLIRHPTVVGLFSDYFEFLWDKAIKLNEHGIRNDLLTALSAQLTVSRKAK